MFSDGVPTGQFWWLLSVVWVVCLFLNEAVSMLFRDLFDEVWYDLTLTAPGRAIVTLIMILPFTWALFLTLGLLLAAGYAIYSLVKWIITGEGW